VAQTALKSFLKGPNSHMASSSQVRSSIFGIFDPKGLSDQSIETSESAFFEVFGDYLMFLLFSIMFNMMIMLFVRVKGYFSRQFYYSKTPSCQSPRESKTHATGNELESICEPSQYYQGNLITKLIKAGVCYTLAFCFFKIALFYAFTFYASGKIDHHLIHHPYGQLRTLQEAPPTTPAVKKPEKISLAMGRMLASFDVEPTEITMSQDEKWAYVSTQNPQLIRVYDTSNFKTPVQVAAVNLGDTVRPKMFLELSTDGTILIASNYEDVKIINVTTPGSPQLVGSFNSPMYKSSDGTVFVSLAISPDNRYLFMAEVGFAILDISDPSNIAIVYSSVTRASTGTGALASFSASRDRKLLYLATGSKTLEVYNVANPRDVQVVSKVPFTDSSATSVLLSKDGKLAYVAGVSGKTVLVNTMDISNPMKIKEVFPKITVVTARTTPPIIQALSPQETKLYVVRQQQLMVIDLLTKSLESNSADLIKNSLVSLAFSSSGKYAGVACLEQIVFIELFTDYPNTKIFTSSNSSTSSFVIDHRFESWAVNNEGNALFLASNDYAREKTAFEIWNPINSRRTASLNATYFGVSLTAPLLSFKMSQDNKRAYLKWWTRETSKLMILDLSGSLRTPKKLKEYELPLSLNFEDFAFSSDEKILCIASDPNVLKLYDSEGPRAEIKIASDAITGSFDLAFTKDNTILLVVTSKISIYNVEDLSNPVLLGSISLTEGGSPRILSIVVLEEENSLIIEWYQTARKLRIYNISDIVSPKLTSEFTLPKRTFTDIQDLRPEFYGHFVYAKNQKMGYVGTSGKLLKVDLSDLKNPAVASIVPVPVCEGCGGISRFLISPDGNSAFVTSQAGTLKSLKLNSETLDLYKGPDVNSQIFVMDLQIQSTLYIPQEKFLLGERYSDNVFILGNNGKQGYKVSTKAEAKVIKLYSYEVKVVSSKTSPEVTPFSLPDWIKFEPDSLLLTIEPKSKKDLGTYTICSAISNEVNKKNLGSFDFAGIIKIPVDQILSMLISLGYMDRQYHLTTAFSTREDFFFPSELLSLGGAIDIDKGKIYDFLSKFYIEACTKIEIVPSLDVSMSSNKIQINTPNTEAVKIEITLVPDGPGSSAQFLHKTYGPLTPDVRDKSKMILEGSLDEVHTALQNVVINAQSETFYDGIVTIHDGINDPIVGRRIENISECFLKNSPPFENPNARKTFQEQIDRMPVVTGQYFAIIWDENTFIDKYTETLHYEVVYDNDGNTGKPMVMPDWLTFSNLALRGTPPEKLTGREVPLKFIVKNEFQSLTIPFKLQIGISPTFIVSLLIKYSPMLLTAIGFYIKANKIYNIVAKKRYKHSKEYHVRIGQEISTETILPILLIEEELKESRIIMNHLLKYLKKRNSNELVSHFVNARDLDKKKLNDSILEAVLNLALKEKKRLKLYLDGSDSDRKKITQLVVNKISMVRIESSQEKQTKLIYEHIKDEFADVVEWDSELLFVVNQEKLAQLLDKKNSSMSTEEDGASLVRGYRHEINQDLLEDAIISHTFSCQSLKARSSTVLLEMHERFERNWVKKFLKQDLEGAHLNNKLGVDYGINCSVENGVLIFSGVPKENFKGRTLAIRVQTTQLRILKEIWIHEKPGKGDETIDLSARTESSLRGNAYEIY